MDIIENYLTLAAWRREVAELYGRIRQAQRPFLAWQDFRQTRDRLFKTHPQSPLNLQQQADFSSLDYFPYDPDFRVAGVLSPVVEVVERALDLPEDGLLHMERFATINFVIKEQPQTLALYWLAGYGGGLFLPFKDGTSGSQSYGGGRYLYDSRKGADLAHGNKTVQLDFNFAYNPSCAYNARWICPLPSRENWLQWAILAGEKVF